MGQRRGVGGRGRGRVRVLELSSTSSQYSGSLIIFLHISWKTLNQY